MTDQKQSNQPAKRFKQKRFSFARLFRSFKRSEAGGKTIRFLIAFIFALNQILVPLPINIVPATQPPLAQADPDDITIVLTPSRTSCVAPCGVFFDATDTTSTIVQNTFTDLSYLWDFGDPGSTFDNRPGVDANQVKGPIAAHVYANPGFYDALVTVTDPAGNVNTEQVTIEVLDQDTFFSTANGGVTYCVSVNDDFAGCPAGADQIGLTELEQMDTDGATDYWNDAIKQVLWSQRIPSRLLFKRGETFNASNTERFHDRPPYMIGAYGSGAAPIILNETTGATLRLYDALDFIVTDLDFRGSYDSSTGLGNRPNGLWIWDNSKRATIYQNKFSGFHLTLYGRPHPSELDLIDPPNYGHHVYADNDVSGWHDYGYLGSGAKVAFVGNKVRQAENTITADEGKGDCSACPAEFSDHGPFRQNILSSKFLIAQNDLFSNNGWTGAGFGIQAVIRLTNSIDKAFITENRMEGGLDIAVQGPHNGNQVSTFENIVYDGNFMIAGENTDAFLGSATGDITARNNIFLKVPSGLRYPGFGTSNLDRVIKFSNPEASLTADRLSHIYNNHVVALVNEAGFTQPSLIYIVDSPNPAPYRHVIKNNMVYMPSASEWIDNRGVPTPEIESDYNLFFSDNGTWYDDQDQNSTTQNPLIQNIPDKCDATKRLITTVTGVEINGDGTRSYLTKAGQNFDSMHVFPNDRLKITNMTDGFHNFDCNYDDVADNTNRCMSLGKTIMTASADTLTIAHDVMHDGATDVVDIEFAYSPSDESKIYLEDTSVYNVGDTVTYNFDETPRSVQTVASDGTGDYIILSSALSEPADGFICKWPSDAPSFAFDFHLDTDSPAIDQGTSVPVMDDYERDLRPQGVYDMGAFEEAGGVNRSPFVNPGPDQEITLPINMVNLDGTVTDDGLPNDTLDTLWTQIAGPNGVVFGDATQVDTTATFPTDDIYVLRLTADDSDLQAFDDVVITVNPALPPPTFTIIATAGNNGSIQPEGVVNVDEGSDQTFTMTPDVGYVVVDVLVDDASVGAVSEHTFQSVAADHTIHAVFAITIHVITGSTTEGGSINPSGDVVVSDGDNQTFTMTPDTGHRILDVLVDNISMGAVSSYEFQNVTEDHTIHATFEINTYSLEILVNGNGQVTKDPHRITYPHGTEVTLTATADPGHQFVDWSGDLSGSENPQNLVMDSNKRVTAAFEVTTYTVGASSSAGGEITPSGDVEVTHGDNQRFQMSANESYYLADVLVDGQSVGVVNEYLFQNVTEPHTIHAVYALNEYTLNVIPEGNGHVDINPSSGPYAHGMEITLTAIPGQDHLFDHWSDDLNGNENPKTFTITQNINTTAHFVENLPPVGNDDHVETDEDTPIDIHVLINDTDSEDGDLIVTDVTPPFHGSASINGDGTVHYTSEANYFGDDQFEYTVKDPFGAQDTAMVFVKVNPINDAPTGDNQSVEVLEDKQVDITLTGSDIDSVVSDLDFDIAIQPAHGQLTGSLPNIVYRPENDYFGTDQFTFIVSDGQLDSAPATVTLMILPTPDAPILSAPNRVTVDEGSTVTFKLKGSDVDDEQLKHALLRGPAFIAVDELTGEVTLSPGFDDAGVYSNVTFEISDPTDLKDTDKMSIHVNKAELLQDLSSNNPSNDVEADLGSIEIEEVPDNSATIASSGGGISVVGGGAPQKIDRKIIGTAIFVESTLIETTGSTGSGPQVFVTGPEGQFLSETGSDDREAFIWMDLGKHQKIKSTTTPVNLGAMLFQKAMRPAPLKTMPVVQTQTTIVQPTPLSVEKKAKPKKPFLGHVLEILSRFLGKSTTQ